MKYDVLLMWLTVQVACNSSIGFHSKLCVEEWDEVLIVLRELPLELLVWVLVCDTLNSKQALELFPSLQLYWWRRESVKRAEVTWAEVARPEGGGRSHDMGGSFHLDCCDEVENGRFFVSNKSRELLVPGLHHVVRPVHVKVGALLGIPRGRRKFVSSSSGGGC